MTTDTYNGIFNRPFLSKINVIFVWEASRVLNGAKDKVFSPNDVLGVNYAASREINKVPNLHIETLFSIVCLFKSTVNRVMRWCPEKLPLNASHVVSLLCPFYASPHL